MKKIVGCIILMLLFVAGATAQTVLKKSPGENSTLTWTFGDDSIISGFRVYAAGTQSGPFTFTGTTAPATARSVTFPTTFSTNSVRLIFQLRAYKTAGTDTVESTGAPADKEVELNVPSPAGLQVK